MGGGAFSFYLSAAILHHQSSSPLSVPSLKDTSGSLVSSEEDSHLSLCLFPSFPQKLRVKVGFSGEGGEKKCFKKKKKAGVFFFFLKEVNFSGH